MNCLVEGNPTPTVTWRRLSDNHVVTMPLTNIRRQNASVGYRCIADNGVRTPAIVEAFIDVQCECCALCLHVLKQNHESFVLVEA